MLRTRRDLYRHHDLGGLDQVSARSEHASSHERTLRQSSNCARVAGTLSLAFRDEAASPAGVLTVVLDRQGAALDPTVHWALGQEGSRAALTALMILLAERNAALGES